MVLIDSYPRGNSLERRLFEEAVQAGDTLRETQIRADSLIQFIQKRYESHHNLDDPEIEQAFRDIDQALEAEMENLTAETYTGDWQTYFRAKLRRDMLGLTLYAPMVFEQKNNLHYRELRRKLVDSAYGDVAQNLEEALHLYHTGSERRFTSTDYGELRGAINEMTALALLNRKQQTNRIATPSLINQDYAEATDINLWHYQDDIMIHTPCQVKSSAYHFAKITLPKGGLLINSHHMHNAHHFRSAEYIVEEVNATLSVSDRYQFDQYHTDFLQYVDSRLSTPTTSR